jgi:hypothetical protein
MDQNGLICGRTGRTTRRSSQVWWFARGLGDGGRVVMDDIVQIDRDHGLHERGTE